MVTHKLVGLLGALALIGTLACAPAPGPTPGNTNKTDAGSTTIDPAQPVLTELNADAGTTTASTEWVGQDFDAVVLTVREEGSSTPAMEMSVTGSSSAMITGLKPATRYILTGTPLNGGKSGETKTTTFETESIAWKMSKLLISGSNVQTILGQSQLGEVEKLTLSENQKHEKVLKGLSGAEIHNFDPDRLVATYSDNDTTVTSEFSFCGNACERINARFGSEAQSFCEAHYANPTCTDHWGQVRYTGMFIHQEIVYRGRSEKYEIIQPLDLNPNLQ